MLRIAADQHVTRVHQKQKNKNEIRTDINFGGLLFVDQSEFTRFGTTAVGENDFEMADLSV